MRVDGGARASGGWQGERGAPRSLLGNESLGGKSADKTVYAV
jgi:hypothetical protein